MVRGGTEGKGNGRGIGAHEWEDIYSGRAVPKLFAAHDRAKDGV